MIQLKDAIKSAVRDVTTRHEYTDAKSMNENKMNTKTESIVKRLKEDSEYQKFFQATMKMFGVKSPKELSDKKKKEFFNYVDKNYKAKSE
jgi:hypothetical protein